MACIFSNFMNPIPRRWLPLLCLVVLLHVFIVHWSFAHFRTTLSRLDEGLPIAVELIPTPALTAAMSKQPASPINPAPTLNPPPTSAAPSTAQLTKDKAIAATISGLSTNSKPTTTDVVHPTNKLSVKVDVSNYVVALPPSAELKCQLNGLQRGLLISGEGRILWMRSNYLNSNIHADFTVANEPFLHFMSDGIINQEHGIVPFQYIEQRPNRTESKTILGSDDHVIRFSTSNQTYPRLGGEQDPASVIWQLSGIGRHDGNAFRPDAEFKMYVAGASKADVWVIRVIAQEEVGTPMGKMQAWHLVRTAPAGSDEQSIDIWLAPEKEWYPVKLRYTEANGDTLDLSVSEITPVPDT